MASVLPDALRTPLLRARHASRIRKGLFVSPEPEFAMLDTLVSPGDWAVDVGANCGYYTARLSALVGETGRVFALEPVPSTFEMLAANMSHVPLRNITLINAAASDSFGEATIRMPLQNSGRRRAMDGWATLAEHHVEGSSDSPMKLGIYTIPLDSKPVRLIKMDVEGHDLAALRGMARTLREHSPVVIAEVSSDATMEFMTSLGYAYERLPGSPNHILRRS